MEVSTLLPHKEQCHNLDKSLVKASVSHFYHSKSFSAIFCQQFLQIGCRLPFMVDVEFDVCVLTFTIPGISTTLNTMSHAYSSNGLHLSIHLRQSTERQVRGQRELDESNACILKRRKNVSCIHVLQSDSQ